MTALIPPVLANASVAFFGEPNLTKCIFLTAGVTMPMIVKVSYGRLVDRYRRNQRIIEIIKFNNMSLDKKFSNQSCLLINPFLCS